MKGLYESCSLCHLASLQSTVKCAWQVLYKKFYSVESTLFYCVHLFIYCTVIEVAVYMQLRYSQADAEMLDMSVAVVCSYVYCECE